MILKCKLVLKTWFEQHCLNKQINIYDKNEIKKTKSACYKSTYTTIYIKVYTILDTYYLYIIHISRKLCLERTLKVYIIYINIYIYIYDYI